MGNAVIRLIARVLNFLHITVRVTNPYWHLAKRRGRLGDVLVELPRATGRFRPPGLPIMVTVDADGSPVGLDQVLIKKLEEYDQVETPGIGIIALQGIGKTFLANLLLYTSAFYDVGTNDLERRRRSRVRIAYDSFKVDKSNRPETASLITDIFKCEVIDPTVVPLNYFSRAFGFTLAEHIELTTDIIEVWRSFTGKSPLSLEEEEVLRQLLRKMYGMEVRSFKQLAKLARRYIPDVDAKDELDIAARYVEDLRHAAFNLYLSLNNFVEGDLARIFGGEDDDKFARLIEQRAVSIHYKNLDDNERTLVELVMSLVQRTAVEEIELSDGKKRRRFPNRVQHYIVQDEAYSSWTNLRFAQRQYKRKKTQRESGIGLVEIFHQLTDLLEAIGAAGSEQARLARNSLNEISIWIVGRQNKSQWPILKSVLGMPDEILRTLPGLKKGHFYIKIPGKAWRLVWVRGTKRAIEKFNTEGATTELLQRYFEDHDNDAYIQWLEATSPEIEEETETEQELVNAAMADVA